MIATTRAKTAQAAPASLQRATAATSAPSVAIPDGYGLLPRGKLFLPVHFVGDDGSYRPLSQDGHTYALCNAADGLKLIRQHMRETTQEAAREVRRRRLDAEEAAEAKRPAAPPVRATRSATRPARPRPSAPATPMPTRDHVSQASLF